MVNSTNILVTGGAGFIGSNFIRHIVNARPDWSVTNLDALTYSGNPMNLADIEAAGGVRYRFVKDDIRNRETLARLFEEQAFDGVFHFAAESHVDRSIVGPAAFVETNVVGTFRLLQAALASWEKRGRPGAFRFLHVSTDEVYGSLGPTGLFTEETAYDPSSPYSASKAASDHFVNAYFRTYSLPTLITNCSNNYGPYQFPEKLIPLMILNIMENKPLPVYGDGKNVRDWLFVGDHCEALLAVFEKGRPGQTYNIGGGMELENVGIVHRLCDLMDARLKLTGSQSSRRLIQFVTDRPGHDRRYAIDSSKIRDELGWEPRHGFDEALEKTVDWYLGHIGWVEAIRSSEYRSWIDQNYSKR
jgi:dTDP-glucose 4,6-dehydratase